MDSRKTMKRILTILKTMVAQIDIPETMTPLEFESFRGFLDEASGFHQYNSESWKLCAGNHHLKMVERTIGKKMGTAGLQRRRLFSQYIIPTIFPDLWEIRSEI